MSTIIGIALIIGVGWAVPSQSFAVNLRIDITAEVTSVSNGLTDHVKRGDPVSFSSTIDTSAGVDLDGLFALRDGTEFTGEAVFNSTISVGDFYSAEQISVYWKMYDKRLDTPIQSIMFGSTNLPGNGDSVRFEVEFPVSSPFTGAEIADDIIGASEILTLGNHTLAVVNDPDSTRIYFDPVVASQSMEFVEVGVFSIDVVQLSPPEPVAKYLDIDELQNFGGELGKLATLRLDRNNNISVMVEDIETGEILSRIPFYSANFVEPTMTVLSDRNGNGYDEIAVQARVIGQKKYRRIIKDSKSGEQLLKRNISAR